MVGAGLLLRKVIAADNRLFGEKLRRMAGEGVSVEDLVIRLFKLELRTGSYGHYDEYLRERKKVEKLAEFLPDFDLAELVERPEGETKESENKKWESRPLLDGEGDSVWVTDDVYLKMLEVDKGLRVEQVVKKTLNASSAFQTVGDKGAMVVQKEGDQYNQRCEVHMPGQALSTYNDIMLLEDCCSDELQVQLGKGWRITAACPQPDQRRPDYILGRFNPELNNDEAADRV
jgi:hypothetical protein